MTDEGMCCGGQLAIPMPFTGAYANAQAAYGLEADLVYSTGTVYAPRPDDVAFRSAGNVGGLNPEINPQPFYNPNSFLNRAPVETSSDFLITTPSLRHGPDLFTYSIADVQPKTQYAPEGELLAEPILMDLSNGPCVCGCVMAYTINSIMLMPANLLSLRRQMEYAGLVNVTPALANTTRSLCGCKILGGVESGVYAGFAAFAQQYNQDSVMQLMDPGKQAAFFTTVYVSRVIEKARSSVTAQAQMNYARAEGPRAQLQPNPVPDCTPSPFSALLPPVLPGTGCNVVETDTLFATRALTDPRSAVSARAALSCVTGLPIGEAPVVSEMSRPVHLREPEVGVSIYDVRTPKPFQF